ncbi:MAG: nuclear transport factor 2 family protein [Pelobium sp.]
MKKLIVLAFTVLAIGTHSFAQSAEKKVEAAAEYLRQALITGVQSNLEYITADSLSYGHSSGKLQNKQEFVNSLVSNQSDFVSINTTQQTIKVVGKTAIVRHNLFAKTNDSGVSGEVKLGIMLVFVNQKGEWKLLARQAYKI